MKQHPTSAQSRAAIQSLARQINEASRTAVRPHQSTVDTDDAEQRAPRIDRGQEQTRKEQEMNAKKLATYVDNATTMAGPGFRAWAVGDSWRYRVGLREGVTSSKSMAIDAITRLLG